MKLNEALLNFEKRYEHYSEINFPENWLEARLLEQIQKTYEEFLNFNKSFKIEDFNFEENEDFDNKPAYVELHKYLDNHFGEVFILGNKGLLDNFTEFEFIYLQKFKSELSYPFSQAHRNGYIYTKVQTFKLPYKYPEEDSVNNYEQEEIDFHFTGSPLFNAPFPIVDWYLDMSKVTKKHPDAMFFLVIPLLLLIYIIW
jgi:hypothetical protein